MTNEEKNKRFRDNIKVGDFITHPYWRDPKDDKALVVYIDSPQNVFVFKNITDYNHDGSLQIRAMASSREEYVKIK